MHFLRSMMAVAAAWALSAPAQDLPLPQFDRGLLPPPPVQHQGDGTAFLKPTTSIRPPLPAATSAANSGSTAGPLLSEEQKLLLEKMSALAERRTAGQRVTAALKRIVVMQGPISKKLDRAEVLPQGVEGKSVTLVGIDAPQDVVIGLESFFGVQLTADTEKKLLDTVRKGMAGASKHERKVEVLGWWPKEGVMAVGVYPEG